MVQIATINSTSSYDSRRCRYKSIVSRSPVWIEQNRLKAGVEELVQAHKISPLPYEEESELESSSRTQARAHPMAFVPFIPYGIDVGLHGSYQVWQNIYDPEYKTMTSIKKYNAYLTEQDLENWCEGQPTTSYCQDAQKRAGFLPTVSKKRMKKKNRY